MVRGTGQAGFELELPTRSSGAEQAVEHGEVFTRRWVVELILDLVGHTVDRDLGALVAVEPACRSRSFVVRHKVRR